MNNEEDQLHQLLQDVDLSGADALPPVQSPPSFDVTTAEASLSEQGRKFLTLKRAAIAVKLVLTTAQMIYVTASVPVADLLTIREIGEHEPCPHCGSNHEADLAKKIQDEIAQLQRMTPRELKDMLWRMGSEEGF